MIIKFNKKEIVLNSKKNQTLKILDLSSPPITLKIKKNNLNNLIDKNKRTLS